MRGNRLRKDVEYRLVEILLPVQEGQEFLSGLRAGAHASEHAAGGCRATGLLDSTHHHAEMRGLHDHTDATRLEDFGDRKRDLFG